MQRIVVVGNGIAGLTAAETIRESGFTGQLLIVGEEVHAPYSRPALSKSAMVESGEMTAHLLSSSEHGAEEILGVRAVSLSVVKNLLTLSDGTKLEYDGLVIASGVHPRRLREDLDIEMTFHTIEDALRLREVLKVKPKVVIIGAGVLGMELASICIASGSKVTVISKRKPLLASLGNYLGDILINAAKEQEVIFANSHGLNVQTQGDGYEVVLENDRVLPADLVISAIGDIPNTSWLQGSGLLTDGELKVDSRGRIRPNIVAAGDIAAIPNSTGHGRVPFWTSAIEQAKVAARALLEGDDAAELDYQRYFWTDQFGLSLKACGELPVLGSPDYAQGNPGKEPTLLRWQNADGTGTAVSLNHRISIPKLRALSRNVPAIN